jgi:hypothetical protein
MLLALQLPEIAQGTAACDDREMTECGLLPSRCLASDFEIWQAAWEGRCRAAKHGQGGVLSDRPHLLGKTDHDNPSCT